MSLAAPRPTRARRGRRRALAVVGALALAATTTLTACSSTDSGGTSSTGAADPDEPITLEFWTYSLKGGDANAEAIIDRYHELHPNVTIKLSEVGGTAETSSKLLAADRADEAPDVVQVEYRALPSLVVAGVVKDITEAADAVRDGVADNIWDLTTFNDRVYGVPQDIGPMMLTYRSDLFEQYGVEPPTTWQEYADAAEQIHEQDPSVYIASYSTSQFEFFAAHAAQAGAEWWSNDGETWSVDMTDSSTTAVADFWQDLVERDLVTVEPLLTPEWNAKVNDGQILSWAAASWAPSVLYSVAPDTAGQWTSIPLPQWTEGDASVPFLGGSTYLVPEKSQHAEAAAEFAAWLSATDEGSQALLTLDIFPGGNAGREATLDSDPPRLMPEQTDFYQVVDEVIDNTTIPMVWGPNVNTAQTAFEDQMSAAALNGGSFRQVYQDVQQLVIDDMVSSGFSVQE